MNEEEAVEMMRNLHESFRAYVAAEAASTRAFIGYQRGEVGEAEVHRLQRAARVASGAHIDAMNAVAYAGSAS